MNTSTQVSQLQKVDFQVCSPKALSCSIDVVHGKSLLSCLHQISHERLCSSTNDLLPTKTRVAQLVEVRLQRRENSSTSGSNPACKVFFWFPLLVLLFLMGHLMTSFLPSTGRSWTACSPSLNPYPVKYQTCATGTMMQ